MRIQPVANPGQAPTPPGATQIASSEARSRAIAMLAGGNQTPPNQNNVQPEEVGAVKLQSQDQSGHSDNNEAEHQAPEEVVQEEPKAEDPALSRQFAQLARQEKALRLKAQQQEQAYRAREEALKAREQEYRTKDEQYKSGYISRDQLKQDPFAVLNEVGLNYDQLTEQILNQAPKDPRMEATISRLEAKIQELTEKTENSGKQYQEQQAQAYQAAVRQIESDVKSLVSSNPEFEAIQTTGSAKDVVDLITQTYDKEGILLSVEEAAQEVENYLMEEAMKLTRIGKIKEQLMKTGSANPSTPAPGKTAGKPQEQTQPQMKTLTNAASSSRPLTARERALLAFKGELKS